MTKLTTGTRLTLYISSDEPEYSLLSSENGALRKLVTSLFRQTGIPAHNIEIEVYRGSGELMVFAGAAEPSVTEQYAFSSLEDIISACLEPSPAAHSELTYFDSKYYLTLRMSESWGSISLFPDFGELCPVPLPLCFFEEHGCVIAREGAVELIRRHFSGK